MDMERNVIEIESKIVQSRLSEAELFSRKFGTFTKTDYEILMFTMFLDSLKGNETDYDISIALGITESKVRNLRVKSQLLYPRDINWVNELNMAITHGHYDQVSGDITVTFSNPVVQNLIKNEIESKFGTVGLALNSKQLILPVESFIILAAFAEKEPDTVIEELNKMLKEETKSKEKIEKKSIKDRFLKNVPNTVAFLANALQLYSDGGAIVQAVINVIK